MKLHSLCVAALVVSSFGLSLVAGFGQSPKNDAGEKHDFSKVDDDRFAQKAEQINLTEIAAGKLAASQGKRSEVKKYGQMMATDHTSANAKLLKAIGQVDKMAGKLDAKHQAKIEKLQSLSGDEFDQTYMKEMVKGHRMAVALLEHQIANGKDQNLKAYAAQTLPSVRTHLQKAQMIWMSEFAKSAR